MTMRSKLIAVVILGAVAASAATPGEVYDRQRDAILSGAVSASERFCFGVGRAASARSSSASRQAAKGRAELLAVNDLLARQALESIRWPDSLGESDRRLLEEAIRGNLSSRVTLKGLQTIASDWDGSSWTVVVSVPEEQLDSNRRMTFEEVRAQLLDEVRLLTVGPAVPLETLCKLRATLGPIPEPVDTSAWVSLIRQARFDDARLNGLIRFAGVYPIGLGATAAGADYAKAQEDFSKGRLQAAFDGFCAVASRGFAYDALNMAGNAGRRIGKEAESAVLLLHAAYLNPDSPYPWVHLAYIARKLGNETLKAACCCEAEARAGDDTWTLGQLEILRKPLPDNDSDPSGEDGGAEVEDEAICYSLEQGTVEVMSASARKKEKAVSDSLRKLAPEAGDVTAEAEAVIQNARRTIRRHADGRFERESGESIDPGVRKAVEEVYDETLGPIPNEPIITINGDEELMGI